MKRWMALALALAALAAAPLRAAAQTQVAWLPAQMRQFQDQPYVNTTQVPSSECAGIWQGALDAGNCSTTLCTPTCLQSLAQVPLSCVPMIVEGKVNVNTTISDAFNDTQAILELCNISVYLNDTGAVLTPTSASINTIVYYLVGICVGAVVTTILFIVLLAAPALAKKTLDAPTVMIKRGRKAAVAGGRAAARRGKAAASKAKGAMQKTEGKMEEGWDKMKHDLHLPASKGELLPPPGSGAAAAAAPKTAPGSGASAGALSEAEDFVEAAAGLAAAGPAALVAAAEAGSEPLPPPAVGGPAPAAGQPSGVQPASAASSKAGLPANGANGSSSVTAAQGTLPARFESLHLVEVAPSGAARTTFTTWLMLATILYLAALPLLIYGLTQFVSNTVAGASLEGSGNKSALTAIEWLIIGGLIVVGVCDLAAFHIVMTANFPVIYVWRWSKKNWFYSKWVAKHAYKIHVVVAGLVIMVLTIACILFGLGILVVTIQLMVQLVCQTLGNLSIEGVRVQDVCIQLPIGGMDEPICGFQALQGCYHVQGMSVLTLVLGAALLLWSHIIWLVVLLLSMYRFQNWSVMTVDAESAQPLMSDPSAALTAGDSQSVRDSVAGDSLAGPFEGPSGKEEAAGGGGGAAPASKASPLRRVQFWRKDSM